MEVGLGAFALLHAGIKEAFSPSPHQVIHGNKPQAKSLKKTKQDYQNQSFHNDYKHQATEPYFSAS